MWTSPLKFSNPLKTRFHTVAWRAFPVGLHAFFQTFTKLIALYPYFNLYYHKIINPLLFLIVRSFHNTHTQSSVTAVTYVPKNLCNYCCKSHVYLIRMQKCQHDKNDLQKQKPLILCSQEYTCYMSKYVQQGYYRLLVERN